MKAPRCRLCGEEHWTREPHKYAASVKAEVDARYDVEMASRNPSVTTSRNQNVTNETANTVTCNHCVTKEQEIERLRNQIAQMESKCRVKPKRDRAQYMRQRRAAQHG